MYTVPGPITGISAIEGVAQLHISWSPPSEFNGVIIVYEVCSNISGVFSYTNTSATQHTLRDLPPNTVVTFSVRAYTIIGPGEYVTGQTTTGSVREYLFICSPKYFLLAMYSYVVACSFMHSSGQRSVSRCYKQHICEGLLDSSQPDSDSPLHYTLHYSGWCQWDSLIPSHLLIWCGVRTAGRGNVLVYCLCHTQCQWRVVH